MNKRQKEVLQYLDNREKRVLKELEEQYRGALEDINMSIRIMQTDEQTPSKVYRIQYQKALRSQIEGIIEKLHGTEYETIAEYLRDSYTDSFVGCMYDHAGQGIPLILPIDENAAAKAIVTDSKLSEDLYTSLGLDTQTLKKTIRQEITRGLASGMVFADIARNVASVSKAPLSRAKTIVKTEAHRIQEAARYDGMLLAKSKGAQEVKIWLSRRNDRVRDAHRQLDGQIREVDKPFTYGTKEAMFPGDFGDPALDCNCGCKALPKATWMLDEITLKDLEDQAAYWGLDKTKEFAEYKKKYLRITDEWASADASAKKLIAADARDNLDEIVTRKTKTIQQGFSAFPENDRLYMYADNVSPDGDKFDVALHGTPTAVCFGSTEANMSPRLLASIIRHSDGYHGQPIRLLSCSTGKIVEDEYCFAEELANALGVTVYAPNDLLYIAKSGIILVGSDGTGAFVPYKPNERKRYK